MVLKLDGGGCPKVLDLALKEFRSVTVAPESYLKIQEKKAQKHKQLVKRLFDYVNRSDDGGISVGLEELIIDDMDEEQIWQQIELRNAGLWSQCVKNTARLISMKNAGFVVHYKLAGEENVESVSEEEPTEDDEEESEDDTHSEIIDDETEQKNAGMSKERTGRSSEVDDTFFKLSEMEAFLDAEDRKEMMKNDSKLRKNKDEDDDEIDYFKNSDGSSDDEEEDLKYDQFYENNPSEQDGDETDFYEQRRKKLDIKNKTKLLAKKQDLGLEDSEIEEDDDNESNNDSTHEDLASDLNENIEEAARKTNLSTLDNEEKSTYEHRQERLKLRIQDMEEEALGEKSWQLRGEINSGSRPQNSLLEEVLQFESTTRPAPIITEETTLQLEDIIRQRIKDKSWNDVERKFKPVNTPQEFRKKLVLNQEKSKDSLAQIYEKEYLKEVEKLNPNADDKEADEPKEHTEIRSIMKGLFAKLDALSNFTYTPKVAAPEVRIITNIAAINMEEVAPITTSDAALLAPEEVRPRSKGDEIGKSERTQTDKNRERRLKKMKQREIQSAKEQKEAERAAKGIVSSNKADKKKLLEKVSKSRNVLKMKEVTDGKSITSSKRFFSQLQDEVTTSKIGKTKNKRKVLEKQTSAKKFKL